MQEKNESYFSLKGRLDIHIFSKVSSALSVIPHRYFRNKQKGNSGVLNGVISVSLRCADVHWNRTSGNQNPSTCHHSSAKVTAVQIIILFNINNFKGQDNVKYRHQNKLKMYCAYWKWHMSCRLSMTVTVNYNHDEQETADCV